MVILFLITTGWPLGPQDTLHALGNNWGEYQSYDRSPYLHPGIDVMGITVGKPVYAVDSGIVKAWLTTGGEWYWRLAIADYETADSVEAWLYAHIDADQYHKNVGDHVIPGDLIGYLVWWPVTGFDHCHFARIKDAGAVWQYADWAFVQNPLVIIEPYDDTTKPVFENTYGGNRFALCQNNTSNYLQPNNLTGNIDIIAKIYDETGLSLSNPVWQRLIPYKIEYEIHGPQNLPTTVSFIFYGVLNYLNNVDVIFKDDATCDTRGDYDYRDYYFIATNTDGDSIIESVDANYSWITTDFPDGDYWVVIAAYDAAGNYQKDSMFVTIDNVGVTEQKDLVKSPLLKIMPNPNNGKFIIGPENKVKIFNINGQLISVGQDAVNSLASGIYFVIWEQNRQIFYQKIVVIK